MIIRGATLADAEAMARLREASIRGLCEADHHHDETLIAAWVGAQGAGKFVALLQQPAARLIVAEIDGQVAGLAGLSSDVVTLNYVHPDSCRRGVGTAMMNSIEAMLIDGGVRIARLESTATARDFYHNRGWQPDGPQAGGRVVNGYPMRKLLGD